MCIGIPMQVVAVDGTRALCERSGERTSLDAALVSALAAWRLDPELARYGPAHAHRHRSGADERRARCAGGRAARANRCAATRFADLVDREPHTTAAPARRRMKPMTTTIPMPTGADADPLSYPLLAQLFASTASRDWTPRTSTRSRNGPGARCVVFLEDPVALSRDARPRGDRARGGAARFPGASPSACCCPGTRGRRRCATASAAGPPW